MSISAPEISARIVEAVMAQRLAPGARLGEQQLGMLFDCSRTIVREALTRLAARGIVTVSARRGWFVIEPSQDEAREAFEARRVIESGLIRSAGTIDHDALRALTVTMPRAASRVSASRTMVRLQSNSMASCCSPRRAPGASFCAITASTMRALISGALMDMPAHQQLSCLLVCKKLVHA